MKSIFDKFTMVFLATFPLKTVSKWTAKWEMLLVFPYLAHGSTIEMFVFIHLLDEVLNRAEKCSVNFGSPEQTPFRENNAT